MKKILLTLIGGMLATAAVYAQQIKGTVTDARGQALSNATVSLLNAKDSSVVKIELSKNGAYAFNQVPQGNLLVSASYVGHTTAYSGPISYKGEPVTVTALVVREEKNNLLAITVSARKPIVETKPGKTVLNVEGTINATGTDALELLRKAPGVMVDKDENLSVNGKNGVQVYIDGRPSPLTAQDLSAYLRSIPSSQIEAIEIISNPSVNYEAAGSAGIINIRLKKNRARGFHGSVNAGLSASENLRSDAGFSLSYRNGKINAFGSYNYSTGNTNMDFDLLRLLKDTAFDQQTKIVFKKNSHNFKTGLDYTLNAKSTIGLMVNGNFAKPVNDNRSITPIYHYPSGTVSRILHARNLTRQQNNNSNANLNYTYRDSSGRSLAVNADYGYYSLQQDQQQPNTFFDATGRSEQNRVNYRIESPTRINIYSLKADYETNLAKGRLGFGGKYGYVNTDNTFNQFNEYDGHAEWDKERSNVYGYKENVNAAYVTYARDFKGFAVQGGVRAEQTNVEGELKSYKRNGNGYSEELTSFKKDYLDFFPNLSFTLAPKTANQLTLSYSRRIDRPVYKDLNPFEYRINEYTLHKGSINIRPQYTNTVSLTHTYRFRLNTTLSYSHVKDLFGQVVDTVQGMKGVLVNRNLASQDITNLNISFPFQYKNYSLFTNVNTYHSRYKANYGEGRAINLNVWAVNIFAQNSFRFKGGWTAEVSGFYTSPSIWQGTLKTSSIWTADAGVQKQIMKGKASLKASVSDLFNSLKWDADSDFSGQKVWVSGKQESRQFKLTFSLRFGNNKGKQTRQFQSGAEEETKRVQSSGGFGQ